MKKRIYGLPLVFIIPALILVLTLGVAFAAWQTEKQFTGNIVIQGFSIGVFEDADCTDELTELNFPSVVPGGISDLTFYVKNTGNEELGIYGMCAWTGPDEVLYGLYLIAEAVNVYPSSTDLWGGTLGPGGVKQIALHLETQNDADLGEAQFMFYIIAKE